jgi:hypothetical protein
VCRECPRATVSRPGADFRGQNVEAPPYPPVSDSSRFGTVSGPDHSQALRFGPLMVELFAALDFRGTPTRSGPVPPVARREAPHVSRVERASQPGPLGRDSHPLRHIAAPLRERSSSLSPPSPGSSNSITRRLEGRGRTTQCRDPRTYLAASHHRIEHRDYSHEPSDVAPGSRARITPVSLRRAGRARLRAPSSTSRHRASWLGSPLSRAGEARFAGWCRPIPPRQ